MTPIAKSTPTLVSLAGEINTAHAAACGAAQSALEHARHAGDLLHRAKAQVAHGQWLPWLREHCPTIAERTAQAYMRVARQWPELEARSKSATVADLPLRDALALLAQPQDDPRHLPLIPTPVPDDFDWLQRSQQTDVAWSTLAGDLNALKYAPEPTTIDGWHARMLAADELIERASRLKLMAQRDLGLLLEQAPWARDLLDHPELVPQFQAACAARIAELQAAEVRR